MKYIEEIKKQFFLKALDEPFTLYNFVWNITIDLEKLNYKEEDIKKIILELIEYFLDQDLFVLGDVQSDYKFSKWNLSTNEMIDKIRPLIDLNESEIWCIYFDLTKNGRNEAIEYLNKRVQIKEEIIKECFKERRTSFNFVLTLVKDIFQTKDSEEIVEEVVDAVNFLIDSDFIDIVYESTWHKVKYDAIETSKFLKKELMKVLNGFELENNLFIQNTSPADTLVKKWQECGGRLVNAWYELIDRN